MSPWRIDGQGIVSNEEREETNALNWLAVRLSRTGDIHCKRIQEILCMFVFDHFHPCCPPRYPEMLRLVAAGDFHTCAITSDGKLHCFGSNDHGQCNVPKHLEHFIVSQLLSGCCVFQCVADG